MPAVVGQGNAQFFDWKVREKSNTVLRMEECGMATPAYYTSTEEIAPNAVDALNFPVSDQGQFAFVAYHNAFSYPNAVNITGTGNSFVWVRMEQYPVDLGDKPPLDIR